MRRRTFWPGPAIVIYWMLAVPATLKCIFWMLLYIDTLRHTTRATELEDILWLLVAVAMSFLIALPPFAALAGGRFVRKKEQQWRQIRRDRLTMELATQHTAFDVQPGPTKPYCLYLRAFESTGQIRICLRSVTTKWRPPGWSKTTETTSVTSGDFETTLAESLEPVMPLVALGAPGEHVGAGRLASDEATWQHTFERLAHRAAAIVLVPCLNAGTAWEMARILSDTSLLVKTAFVIPPVLGFPNRSRGQDDFLHASRFGCNGTDGGKTRNESIRAIAQLGVELRVPDRGTLIFFGRTDTGALALRWQAHLWEDTSDLISLFHFLMLASVWTFSRRHLRWAITTGIARTDYFEHGAYPEHYDRLEDGWRWISRDTSFRPQSKRDERKLEWWVEFPNEHGWPKVTSRERLKDPSRFWRDHTD